MNTQHKSAADTFMDLIVAFLAPMFLAVVNGDIHHARAAALETVNAYRAQSKFDLLSVAQLIAFGLAALGSLSLSMADDISLSMTLRLRANAVAANRASEQCRRALAQTRSESAPLPEASPADDFPDEVAIAAGVEQVRQHAADAKARIQPAPSEPAADDEQRRTLWANAMADVAAEVTASLPHLPRAQRRAASMRAAALSSTAHSLLTGDNGQLPPRFKPGHPIQPR